MATKPTRKRPHFVGVWLSDNGLQAVNKIVERERLSRSDTLRRMLSYAALRMPNNWRP